VMAMKKNKKSGFTLIELMVVLAIMGVLMLLLLPALASTRKQAHAIDCMNNMKQLIYAAFMYADDHDGVIPDVAPVETEKYPDLATSNYIDDEDVYLCPRDTRKPSEFGSFKTSYTAWKYTIASLLPGDTKNIFSERVLYVESDKAGVNKRGDIVRADIADDRHEGRAILAYADGHLSSVFLGGWIYPAEEPAP